MLDIETKLTGDLAGALDRFEKKIQGQVLIAGVAKMARVIYDEVKLKAPTLGRPHWFYGTHQRYLLPVDALKNAVYRVYAKEQSSDTVKYYKVSVNKKKAPHWAMVEYGTSRAPAHPYIRPAFDKMGAAIEAGKVRMREQIGKLGEIEIGNP